MFGEPGMQRREISEIPKETVREAIANALPHRDHTTDTAVEVNVYMDFVERGEPGALPRGRRSGKPPAGADGGLKQRNPGIAPTAQKVVNLAAEADIEDVMSSMMLERMRFCTLETVPVAQLAAAAISRCV